MMDLDIDKKQLNKFCKYCGKFKLLNEFTWLPSVKRYHNYCKECDRAYKHNWYVQNKYHADTRRKKWQEENYELHLEHQRKYNAKRIKHEQR